MREQVGVGPGAGLVERGPEGLRRVIGCRRHLDDAAVVIDEVGERAAGVHAQTHAASVAQTGRFGVADRE
jgi:hypothetical protein